MRIRCWHFQISFQDLHTFQSRSTGRLPAGLFRTTFTFQFQFFILFASLTFVSFSAIAIMCACSLFISWHTFSTLRKVFSFNSTLFAKHFNQIPTPNVKSLFAREALNTNWSQTYSNRWLMVLPERKALNVSAREKPRCFSQRFILWMMSIAELLQFSLFRSFF